MVSTAFGNLSNFLC